MPLRTAHTDTLLTDATSSGNILRSLSNLFTTNIVNRLIISQFTINLEVALLLKKTLIDWLIDSFIHSLIAWVNVFIAYVIFHIDTGFTYQRWTRWRIITPIWKSPIQAWHFLTLRLVNISFKYYYVSFRVVYCTVVFPANHVLAYSTLGQTIP